MSKPKNYLCSPREKNSQKWVECGNVGARKTVQNQFRISYTQFLRDSHKTILVGITFATGGELSNGAIVTYRSDDFIVKCTIREPG